MKTIHSLLLAAGMTALVGFAPMAAQAEPVPATAAAPAGATVISNNYAFVNMNRILFQCDAGKALRQEVMKKKDQFKAELKTEDNALKSDAQTYQKEKAGLSKEQLAQKNNDLERKFNEAGKMLQNREQILDAAANKANGQLTDAAVKIIAKIAKENGYAAVFSHEAVVIAAEKQDITEQVLSQLNATVKHIPIDWTAASKAGGQ